MVSGLYTDTERKQKKKDQCESIVECLRLISEAFGVEVWLLFLGIWKTKKSKSGNKINRQQLTIMKVSLFEINCRVSAVFLEFSFGVSVSLPSRLSSSLSQILKLLASFFPLFSPICNVKANPTWARVGFFSNWTFEDSNFYFGYFFSFYESNFNFG